MKSPTEQIASDPKQAADKITTMLNLLLECRDALPAISLASARLHNVSLTLADRIEACLEPWRVE